MKSLAQPSRSIGKETRKVSYCLSLMQHGRRRSLMAGSDVESSDLASRFRTGIEVCTLSSCVVVWEETFGNNGYDPGK